jgi:large subunit ribosomal protein L13
MGPKTHVVKGGDITREWFVVDATGKRLGRLSSDIAYVLKGKHKPYYTPAQDVGDHVIVINAGKVAVTGNKLTQKFYYRHSGYPGGFRAVSLAAMLKTHPERVIEHAVRGMLPRNKLGDDMYAKLRVHAGPAHPHQGQQPRDLTAILPQARGIGRAGLDRLSS